MLTHTPIISICTTCRDGRETANDLRGGARLAQGVLTRMRSHPREGVGLRGVQCMSQCKRPCVASLSASGKFTYVFGDLDPEQSDHIDALLELVSRYAMATEGFLERMQRPDVLRSNILGRIPPVASTSALVTNYGVDASSLKAINL